MDLLQNTAITKLRSWILESLLVTLLWCLPLGLAALIFALRGREKWKTGDYQGAVKDIAKAKYYSIIGFWVGLGWIIISGLALTLMQGTFNS